MATLLNAIAENWTVWFVTVVLIVAAVIDGAILKVPNWLTFPFILCGWMHWTLQDGLSGFGWSLLGTFVGMMLLLVLRNVGGMGAGDVKLLAGVGAWLGTVVTLYAFAATAIVGGIMAVVMILRSGQWEKHVAHGPPDSARMENDPEPGEACGNCPRTEAKYVPAALRNPDGNRLDRLLCLRWHAGLSRQRSNSTNRINQSRTVRQT